MINGFNATTFAYGTTGTGKTHTMLGKMVFENEDESGILYLALQDCFNSLISKRIDFELKLSYLEIYNEHVIDLLDTTGKSNNLLIVEDPIKGIVVPELLEFHINNLEDAKGLIEKGNSQRAMASTAANQFSTRSHAVLKITIEQRSRDRNVIEEVMNSKLCLIDLAGSERGAATENRGQRMVEGANINRSLLALGNCINILSDSKNKGRYVPYRDSKLTRILKDSLGGNTKTSMIACVSPSPAQFEETMNTLKYAERARNIKNDAVRNIKVVEAHVSEYKEIIQSLRQEIEFLKIQLNKQDESPKPSIKNDSNRQKSLTQSEQPETVFNNSDYEKFSHSLLANFEEHWEIKKSIKEIEYLNQMNTAKLKQYMNNVDSGREKPKDITYFKNEMAAVKQNIKENEVMKNDLLENLYSNLKVKAELQSSIGNMKVDKKREVLELQIALRNLKLEKLDLHVQNSQIKQEALKVKQESKAKDRLISKMKDELDTMKKQLKRQASMRLPRRKEMALSASTNSFKIGDENLSKHTPDNSQEFTGGMTFLSSPSIQSTQRMKLSGLEEARRARKAEMQSPSPAKETVTFINNYIPNLKGDVDETPSKKIEIRSASLRASRTQAVKISKTESTKPENELRFKNPTSIRGISSNLQIKKERIQSADRRRRSSPTKDVISKSNTKVKADKDTNKKDQEIAKLRLSKLAKSLNQRILTADEAAEIVRQQWKKKPTPLVKISLSKA